MQCTSDYGANTLIGRMFPKTVNINNDRFQVIDPLVYKVSSVNRNVPNDRILY